MKNILAFTALLAVSAAASANAASLSVVQSGEGASKAFSLYLNGGADNGNFDTVSLVATPDVGSSFANPNSGTAPGVGPRAAGEAFTFRNRFLDLDPLDDPQGKGWTVLGVVTTAQALSFDGGPLGLKISTAAEPGGNLFLANFNMPTGMGQATVNLFNSGAPAGTLSIPIGIPEPATLAMAGLGLVGVIAASRRKS